MKIYIGADHAGFELKKAIIEHLQGVGHEVVDVGAQSLEHEDDYTKYAYGVAVKILGEEDVDAAHGVLICGSGQGMSIAANRVRGIRAALAWSLDSAKTAKRDDNANVLVFPAKFIDEDEAVAAVDAWLKTAFDADPKYQRRLDQIEELYG
jgi:ribose 5-phosphate isomerase B